MVVALLVLIALGATACGGGDGSATAKGVDVPLVGTMWVLDQDASTLEVVAPEVVVTIRFSGELLLSGTAGCNSYNGRYQVSGDSLSVAPGLATTEKLCAPPASNVEAAYLERLPPVHSYAIDGKVLTLRAATKGADLIYRAQTPGN
jgi:heat shock protein HslJ